MDIAAGTRTQGATAETPKATAGPCAQLAAALDYAAQGFKVFPIAAGAKKPPLIKAWQLNASNDPDQVRVWWAENPTANIGINCGASGLFVVDQDIEDGVDGIAAWHALAAAHRFDPDGTRTSITPRGGRHAVYKMPASVELRNTQGDGSIAQGIDSRGHGGYIVAPPSRVGDKFYKWEDAARPIAELPEAALALFVAGKASAPLPLEAAPIATPAPVAMVKTPTENGRKSHLSDFARKDTALRHHAEGESCGKCPFSGCTSKDDGFVVFHNEGIERRSGLKFEEFTGRFFCRKCGRKGDAADYLMMRHGMYRAQALQALGLDKMAAAAGGRDPKVDDQGDGFTHSEPWEDPVTFDAPLALPAIPTEALPPTLAEFVREVAVSFEVHTDLPAACVLGVAAAGCQKKYRVHIHGDHYEPTNVGMLPVSPPGDRKSAVVPFVAAPLFDYEDFLRERDKGKVELAIAEHKVQAARREHLQKRAATESSADKRAEAARELREMVVTATDPPVLPMLTVGADVTSEALANILNQHGGRITICDAEGGRLFGNVGGHYSNGSPNIEVLLAGHAGDLLKVHRKGGGEIVVKHPAVTTILAVQPDVVRTLAGVFKSRGLAGRFLYVFPQPMAGHRGFDGQAVREDVRAAYNATIRAVFELEPARGEDGTEVAHLLKFTADAYAVQREMSRATDRQMLPGEPLAEMTDWGSKAAGAAARIAGQLHVLEHAQHGRTAIVPIDPIVPIREKAIESTLSFSRFHVSTTTNNGTIRTIGAVSPCSCGGRPEAVGICPSTVLNAWTIVTCLKEHARHAYALMTGDAKGEFSREILGWVNDRKPTGTKADDGLAFDGGKIVVFSKRALHRRFRTRGEDLRAALRVLEEMGYIRRSAEKGDGIRPSEKYEVNPKWAR